MRLGRIASPDRVAFVSIEGDAGAEVAREIAEHPFGTPTFTERSWPLAEVRLLAPILASKVVCMGKNYLEHVIEMGGSIAPENPIIFLKPNTAIIGPGAPIQLPVDANPVHHEGELAVVIGQPCKDVTATRAAAAILGYTIANDVSARDQQQADGQWTRAKGHDTFCPVGPWIVTDLDPSDLEDEGERFGEAVVRYAVHPPVVDPVERENLFYVVAHLMNSDIVAFCRLPAGIPSRSILSAISILPV